MTPSLKNNSSSPESQSSARLLSRLLDDAQLVAFLHLIVQRKSRYWSYPEGMSSSEQDAFDKLVGTFLVADVRQRIHDLTLIGPQHSVFGRFVEREEWDSGCIRAEAPQLLLDELTQDLRVRNFFRESLVAIEPLLLPTGVVLRPEVKRLVEGLRGPSSDTSPATRRDDLPEEHTGIQCS